MITLDGLSELEYSKLRLEVIKDVEQLSLTAYFDSAHGEPRASIGYGYNLAEESILNEVLDALGMSLDRIIPEYLGSV